ncbi:hypothetical protein [Sphingobium boeckii]|uniref:Glycerophosphoryl diester phosphodiesterase membrane domain-containing protein n=1 Tax=Sphingobium boeckii TaxID=1082345 RepID=A0A7W9AKB3_9SPHN|nr:hypothetical protein [Sphingobium boeckii]MBB5687042.1 hypothetical protein [Sphingobium boeckii]
MAGLSISKAWDETAAFVGREGGLLFPVAFVFLALPAIIVGLMMPTQLESAKTMTEMMALIQPILPRILGAFLITTIIGLLGGLTLYTLTLKPAGTSVGEAIAFAMSRFVVALGATLILFLGWIVACILPYAIARSGAGPVAGLLILAMLPLVIFVAIRMMIISAVVIGENLGPVGTIQRAWALTKGAFWKLFGFVLVFGIVVIIVSLVGDMLFGLVDLVIGQNTTGIVSLIGGALLNTVINVYMLVMTARLYRQLAA